MKKVLTTLIFIIFLLFLGTTFYVFEIPPLNPGGPFIPLPETIEEGATNISEKTTLETPEFLSEEKVGRAKTYTEHTNRAALLIENGYQSLAIAEYESASKLAPKVALPHIEIGKIHYANQDFIKAKVNFEQALTLDPDNLEAQINLGRTLIANRDLDNAQKLFDSIEIHNQISKYYLGIVTAYSGDHEKAKNLLNEVISIGGDESISANAQNFLNAYAEFDSNQGGNKIHLQTLLARSFIQTGEQEIAIPLLFDVVKEKNDYRDAWVILGYAYLSTQKFKDAADALEEGKKLDPQKPETTYFLGLAYYGLGDMGKAASNLELAKKNGFEPVVQVDQKLAEVYLQLKEYEKSADSYENVISLNSGDVSYFIKPIWIYIDRLNQPEKAMTLANKAVALHPNQAMSYNLLGWASISSNQLTNAQNLLDKARSLDPNLDAVYLNYGLLFEKKGDAKTAISYYKQAYEKGQGNSIANAAADHYNKLIGKTDNLDYSSLKADLLNP